MPRSRTNLPSRHPPGSRGLLGSNDRSDHRVNPSPNLQLRRRAAGLIVAWVLLGWSGIPLSAAEIEVGDEEPLIGDRIRIERVYHERRIGESRPFDKVLPWERARVLVRRDQLREQVLASRYGVTVTAAMLAEEVRRIDDTSRAPATLARLKEALNHDVARFRETVARPIVVERELRRRFENDHQIPGEMES